MRGQYCGQCGQRSGSRLISLWELVRDAFGDLFELDSRLWQTLVPLLVRPGRLTADYLQGKRARFMPPFRMYLVLSLLFFVVAFFDPTDDLALLYADQTISAETVTEPDAAADADADADADENLTSANDDMFNIQFGDKNVEDLEDDDCDVSEDELEDLPVWLRERLTPARIEHVCLQTQLDDGAQLKEKLLDNIPAALIVLLPLMAFVLKLLYPLSRRFYVEHVLFFVHFHAFFFLLLTLQILWSRLVGVLALHEALVVVPISIIVVSTFQFTSLRQCGASTLKAFCQHS